MSIENRVARVDGVGDYAHVGEGDALHDLLLVLVEGDHSGLERPLCASLEDVLGHFTPAAVALEAQGANDVTIVEVSVLGELGLLCGGCGVVGHGHNGIHAGAMKSAVDVVKGRGTVIGHVERCAKVSLVFVDVEICGAIVGVGTELEVGHFEARSVVGGEHLATEGGSNFVVDGDLVDIAEASEGVVAFDVAHMGLALGTHTLLAIDVETEPELDERDHLGVGER